MNILGSTLLVATGVLASITAGAYPLDGGPPNNIRRIEGFLLAQERPGGPKLSPGALLGIEDMTLALTRYAGPDFDALPADPALSAALDRLFGQRDPSYSLVLVDYSDPAAPRWAALRPDLRQNAGSVGKVLCMLALFNELARAFPDTDDRRHVLATTLLRAGDWVIAGEHQVPKWNAEQLRNQFGIIVPADEFYLSEWLDHAISASANGAGSVIWREAMLLRHFGSAYPVGLEASEAFFRDTPRQELAALAAAVINEPLVAAGIDTAQMTQGSFWTRVSKQKVPGSQSFATPRELARLLFRLEQGRLVDAWSSLEMKRYLYMTKRRYRYAYAPELSRSAVYFKSGSLYQCVPEEGYRCGKYMGNKRNMMNSIAIIESPAGPAASHRYLVTLMSNVLYVNSAWDHSRIAAAIQELVLTGAPVRLKENGTAEELREVGKSD